MQSLQSQAAALPCHTLARLSWPQLSRATLPPGRLEGQQRHGPLVRAVHLGVEGELLAAQLKVPKLEGDPGDGGPAGLQGGQVQPALGHSDTLHLRVGGRHVPLLGRVVLLRDVNAVGLFRFGMEDL